MCPSPRSHHVIFNTCAFANRQLAPLLNRLFYSIPPVNNHRRGSSRLIRAPVLVVDLLTSLGVTPPPCPVTPAEYLPNQPYGAHADSNRIVNMQLCVVCKSFYGCSASMLITVPQQYCACPGSKSCGRCSLHQILPNGQLLHGCQVCCYLDCVPRPLNQTLGDVQGQVSACTPFRMGFCHPVHELMSDFSDILHG